MNWRTVSTIVGMTICTVGGSYAVNMASGGGPLSTVLLFLAAAVVLTGLQIAFQLRSDSRSERVSNEKNSPRRVRIRTEGRGFIGWWVCAIVFTFVQVLVSENPSVVDWARSHHLGWLGLDQFAGGTWLWVVRGATVVFFLVGLESYWSYRKGWLDVGESGMELSSPSFGGSVAVFGWLDIKRIYWRDDVDTLAIEHSRTDDYVNPYNLFAPGSTHVVDAKKLVRALALFAGDKYEPPPPLKTTVGETARRVENDTVHGQVRRFPGIRRPPGD